MLHIGISGPIASGKSTLAQKLTQYIQWSDYTVQTIPFAFGIRELIALEHNSARVLIMADMLSQWGLDATKAHYGAILIDQAMTQYPSTPGVKNRRLMQMIGHDIGRESLSYDLWISHAKQLLRNYRTLDFGISDDLRYNNEAMAVDVHVAIDIDYGPLWDIWNDRIHKLGKEYTFSEHASEQSLTLLPLLTIPVGFTDDDVQRLFEDLNYIRIMRAM